MRVYSTDKGCRICEAVTERGYAEARSWLGLTNDELDELRLVCDPVFGVERLRGDELGSDPNCLAVFRKLADAGYVRLVE